MHLIGWLKVYCQWDAGIQPASILTALLMFMPNRQQSHEIQSENDNLRSHAIKRYNFVGELEVDGHECLAASVPWYIPCLLSLGTSVHAHKTNDISVQISTIWLPIELFLDRVTQPETLLEVGRQPRMRCALLFPQQINHLISLCRQ